jgi:demethylmenaquinone methyltransferase/2-methoxy-6-polyprenyl-1,4-benzoquinol methylase
MPFQDGSFDGAAIAFGLRNLEDRSRGLAELARVVRPGGLVAILEFTLPPNRLVGLPYRWYFTRVLPLIGRLFGHAEAYRYLPDTVLTWPPPRELEKELAAVGLTDCRHELLSFGIAALHVGRVAPRSAHA